MNNSGIVYIAHAYTPNRPYKSKDSYKKRTVDPSQPSTKSIVGRKSLTTHRTNPYGNYASPYYDPVERHARYEREKDHVTRPYGVGLSESKKGRGSGKGGSGKGGSGKGGSGKGKGSGKGANKNISDVIAKLREESSLDTEAHREAAKRKIEDLKKELAEWVEKLRKEESADEQSLNIVEIRGKIQSIRDQIEQTGGDLQKWISDEREALSRRIAKLKGEKYDDKKLEQQKAVKNREKEISSRADAIYKRKSRK